MSYKNAEELFPAELLSEIRAYISDGFVYIPKESTRAGWGMLSGQKEELRKRNLEILQEFRDGKSVEKIAREQFLAKSTIYRILRETR